MKKTSLFFTILLCITMLPVFSVGASAAGYIDTAAHCSFTLEFEYNGEKIPGAQFSLHCVGTVSENADIVVSPPFDVCGVSINTTDISSLSAAAQTFAQKVSTDNIPADYTAVTDKNGSLKIENLPVGMYLLVGKTVEYGSKTYDTAPQIIFLPFRDSASSPWCYDITVHPKKIQTDETEEKISVSVVKKWADAGYEDKRPRSVTVNLLCDGQVHSSVTLSADNDWQHTWADLSAKRNWTVQEKVPEKYFAKTEQNGTSFVIVNTRENIDNTGQLWWPVPVMLASGILLTAYGTHLKKRSADE